jgi:DNA-binding NtrC family response regulator
METKGKLGNILIVDDNEDILLAARLLLRPHADSVHTEKDPNKIPPLLRDKDFDVILLDMNFTRDVSSGKEGFDWLGRILEIDPRAVVVLVTAYGDVDMAVRAIKEGAFDFIQKPWQNEKLLATISAGMNMRATRLEAEGLRLKQRQLSSDMDQPFNDFLGTCPAMREVFATIQKVADTDANILILGENGTGKELVAREIHRQSGRADEVFISVDMGAVNESLFESELFGHKRGAFTDAREDKPGRFETAHGGTLFLDEIGNLPLFMQSRLLAVLENRSIIRLGSNIPHQIDIRLISASNLSLNQMVDKGEFRQDLLYRINTVEIHLPPLREREDDIDILADHFLKMYRLKYKKPIGKVGASALKMLRKHNWPGNVRELQHAIERAVILSDSDVLQARDFSPTMTQSSTDDMRIEDYNLKDIEKTVIQKAMRKYRGNVSHAARELGLTRASLYRRIQKYDL